MASADFAVDVDAAALDIGAPLANTGLTIGRVLEIIGEHCEPFRRAADGRRIVEARFSSARSLADCRRRARALQMSAVDISEGVGYLSRVFRTQAIFSLSKTGDNDEATTSSFTWIMKIPTLGRFIGNYVHRYLR